MFGSHFYHERIRKSVAMFGTMFNNLYVVRTDGSGNTLNHVRVPLSYGPAEKYLQRIREQNNLDTDRSLAIKLPRMSFEMMSMMYDPTRQLPKTGAQVRGLNNESKNRLFNTAPYNLQFQLNIYARSQDDCLQIVEQIIPYFTPQYTLTIKPLADFDDVKEDVPIILTGVNFIDDYEGSLEDRRIIQYTLDFEMKINFHSAISEKSIIRKSISNVYEMQGGVDGSDADLSRVTVVPDPINVSPDDDYGFNTIVQSFDEIYPNSFTLTLAGKPVRGTATVDGEQVTGITLDSAGYGFNNFSTSIVISDPAGEERALGRVLIDSENYRATRVIIDDSGRNYISAPTVSFSPATEPVNATVSLTMDGDRVGSIAIVDSGTNYYDYPAIVFSNPQTDPQRATATLTVDSGVITAIVLVDSGVYYKDSAYATVTYDKDSADSAVQTGFTIPAIISNGKITGFGPIPDHDSSIGNETVVIDSADGTRADFRASGIGYFDNHHELYLVELTDSGRFYTSAPTATVEAPEPARTATGYAVMDYRRVKSVVITDRGLNYFSNPTITFSVPQTATTATATAVINNGRVTSVTITDQGNNYYTTPTVEFTNPIPYEEQQFIDSENVTIDLGTGVTITGKVKSWDDASNQIVIDTIRASDNNTYELTSVALDKSIVGETSGATLSVASVSEGAKGFD